MDPDRIRTLIRRLIAATRHGKLRWEDTAEENLFRLSLSSGMIQIHRRLRQLTDTLFEFEFTLVNEHDTVVDEFHGATADDDILLRELWEQARNSALKPDEFLGRIEQEIKQRANL